MAASFPLPLLLLILLSLSISASARPCKGIFFFASTSYYSQNNNNNPNPTYVTFYLTSTSTSPHTHHNRFFLTPRPISMHVIDPHQKHRPIIFNHDETNTNDLPSWVHQQKQDEINDLPTRVRKAFINDRTKDVMSVVGALLFGMGCGALTAATMYLVWSLFMPNRFEFEDSDDEEFEGGEVEDLYNPKKPGQQGYVAIPSGVVDEKVKTQEG